MKTQPSRRPPPAAAAPDLLEACDAAVLDTSPDAVISIAPNGHIIDWNPAAEAIFGYTRALAMGRDAAALIAPDPTAAFGHAELAQILKSGKGRLLGKRSEMTAVRANGSNFPVELTLLRAPDPNPLSFIACIRDLTERRQAETVLRRSEERFRLLVEGVEDYVIHLLDPHGRVLTWNAGVERIEGYSARDIIGRRFHRFYTQEEVACRRPEQALATAEADGRHRHEGWSVRKNGTRYWASVVLTALRDPAGVLFGYSRIGCDCTRSQEAESRSARVIAQLEDELRVRAAELQAAMLLLQEAQGR